ncbi:MAG: phosphoenolpyruvate synthase [Deltaproteobacteria bacterium]|nr:MAG: phosphoenolpyruvate synthase [Deltaproteobacteria bacterium]
MGLIALRHYLNPWDAELARGMLDSAGIEAVVFDQNTVYMNWLYSNAIGGVRLMVHEEDLAEAAELLGEADFARPHCPKCGSADIEAKAPGGIFAFLSTILLGIPHFFISKKAHCKRCGHEFSTNK